MKKLIFLFFGMLTISLNSYSQTDYYNLKSQNLHKKVAKTIEHSYSYNEKNGGFVKTSISINNYNEKGNLTSNFFQYNSTYNGTSSTTETLYNYNSKNQMISTQDISAKKSSYSSYNKYYYDKNGNLSKKETLYDSGSIYVSSYFYDNKDRLIRAEEYNNEGQLSARENYTYSGKTKIKVRKSYDTKTGNVIGTYTTYYKDELGVRMESSSQYYNSDLTINYDSNNNVISNIEKDKPSSNTSYTYKYDTKDNWIIRNYKSATTTYSYSFREIIFTNGDITGTTDFDKEFVAKNGNLESVVVIPFENFKPTTNTTTTTITSDPKLPIFKSKKHIFNYVNLDKKVSSVSGEVSINVLDNDRMSANSSVEISYVIGGKTYKDTYNVVSFSSLTDYNYWFLKSKVKSTTIALTINHEKTFIESRNMYLAGTLNILFEGKETGFYLE